MNDENIGQLPMVVLCERILPFRGNGYITKLIEKLLLEGIAAPSDLLLASDDALETKLKVRSEFNYIELADTMSLRIEVQKGSHKAPYRKDYAEYSAKGAAKNRQKNHSAENSACIRPKKFKSKHHEENNNFARSEKYHCNNREQSAKDYMNAESSQGDSISRTGINKESCSHSHDDGKERMKSNWTGEADWHKMSEQPTYGKRFQCYDPKMFRYSLQGKDGQSQKNSPHSHGYGDKSMTSYCEDKTEIHNNNDVKRIYGISLKRDDTKKLRYSLGTNHKRWSLQKWREENLGKTPIGAPKPSYGKSYCSSCSKSDAIKSQRKPAHGSYSKSDTMKSQRRPARGSKQQLGIDAGNSMSGTDSWQ